MRALGHSDIAALASQRDLIPVIAEAMRRVSAREVEMPLRFVVPLAPGEGFGVMTGATRGLGHGAKLLTLKRREKGSSHTGALILFDRDSGAPAVIMDSGFATALRTAAASAVATQALARENASTLAVLGTGEQAHFHIEAIRTVRPILRVMIWGRSADKAAALAEKFPEARAASSVAEACAEADIICTVTSSPVPILHARDLPEGVHVNAVGASQPSAQEIAPDLYGTCRAFVDYRPSADAQSGELIEARATGIVPSGSELPEIGEVLLGRAPGRANAKERILYRSLGLIAQDLAIADFLLRGAEATGRGTVIDLYD